MRHNRARVIVSIKSMVLVKERERHDTDGGKMINAAEFICYRSSGSRCMY